MEYYLYHHGILGQRWGKRNGPPYPLGASDHSASEKKALDEQCKEKYGCQNSEEFLKKCENGEIKFKKM